MAIIWKSILDGILIKNISIWLYYIILSEKNLYLFFSWDYVTKNNTWFFLENNIKGKKIIKFFLRKLMRKLKRRKKKLTPRQQKLCENYVKLQDKEQAYFAAGYKGNGNHEVYIRTLFDKPEVIEYIEQLEKESQTDLSDIEPKFQLFLKDYLTHFNASRAYHDNISPLEGSSLYAAASLLLNRPKIQEALQREMTARCDKLDVEGDRLVDRKSVV